MRASKAKLIRKIMYEGVKHEVTQYDSVLHPFTTDLGKGNTITGNKETLVAAGHRRAYLIGKKIYKRFGVLPVPQELPAGE